MKKTNTQFVVVFFGVLILHLAVATALMNSAHTEAPDLGTSSPDPYYHSNPSTSNPEQSPGWGTAETPRNTPEPAVNQVGAEETGNPPESIPDAFATATEAAKSSPKAAPVKEQPAPQKAEPVPDPPTRRLTVTQLLTPDAAPPREEKPEDNTTATKSTPTTGSKVKPLPVSVSNSGPRKIRSLSGN